MFSNSVVMSAMRLHRRGPQSKVRCNSSTFGDIRWGLWDGKMMKTGFGGTTRMPFTKWLGFCKCFQPHLGLLSPIEPSEDEAAPWPRKLKGAETHPRV